MIYGYARVSSKEQCLDRQLDTFRAQGIKKIVLEKQSGKDTNRPELQKLLESLQAGDTLAICSLDRLSRNYEDVLHLWQLIEDKKAYIKVLDMPLLDTSNKQNGLTGELISKIVLQLLAYVAQTEREQIKERQRQGIEAAQKRGVRFGRPAVLTKAQFLYWYDKVQAGEMSAGRAIKEMKVARATFYKFKNLYVDVNVA